MKIDEYPDEIAKLQKIALASKQAADSYAGLIEIRKADFRRMVLEDPALTNDAKRKDALKTLELTDDELLGYGKKLATTLNDAALATIEADRLIRMYEFAMRYGPQH